MITSKNDNAVPQSGATGPAPQAAGPNGGALIPANEVLPIKVYSEGSEWGPPALSGAESAGVAGILKALQQRWILALVVGLICGAAAGVPVWYLKPPKYTVFGLLHVAGSEHRLLEGDKENETGRMTFLKTQAAMITSSRILRGALREEKVRQLDLVRQLAEPEAWLEKELKVGYIEDTELLRIALTGPAPKDLAILINAIQASYMAQIVEHERNQQRNLKEDLERIVLTSQDKLRKQRTELKNLAEIMHTGDSQALTAKQRNTLEEYAALKREFAGIKSQLRSAQMRLEIQKARVKATENLVVPEVLVDQYLELDPGIILQQGEVARAQSNLLSIEKTTSEGSPLRKKPQQALIDVKQALEKLRADKRPVIVKRLRQKIHDEAETGIVQTEEEMRILERQQEDMKDEVKKVSTDADRIGTTSLDLEMKKGEIDQADSVVKLLSHEKEKLEIELQSTAYQRVSVYQQAEPTETPNTKEHIQESALAGLCAMSLGIFCVAFREFRARWVSTAEEVSKDLGMRVVGTLPDLSNWAGKSPSQLVGSQDQTPVGIMRESIESIRTILSCSESDASARVLMITSAVSREGKTTLAAQLAASFAYGGKRTLLVDFDLRNPSLHRLLGQPQTPGVCEVLRGEIDLADAVRTTDVPGLFLLPAGTLSRSVLTSCLQNSGEAFFERLRSEYQFIAVDSSPVVPVPDALLLGRYVDAAVFSVRPRVSRFPPILAACERLRSVRIPLLGTVVNGVRWRKDHEYYRYVTQTKD